MVEERNANERRGEASRCRGNARTIDFAAWFGRATWLGILANFVLAIPGILWPNATLGLAGQTPDLEHPVWPAFASLLLVLLSLFYIPGAIEPPATRRPRSSPCWRGWPA